MENKLLEFKELLDKKEVEDVKIKELKDVDILFSLS